MFVIVVGGKGIVNSVPLREDLAFWATFADIFTVAFFISSFFENNNVILWIVASTNFTLHFFIRTFFLSIYCTFF